jgi:anti-sigma regulatory factor (Ser/Thr protein kinase)
VVRRALGDWLDTIGLAGWDREGLQLAMVEVFTNAIEHAIRTGPARCWSKPS